MYMVLKKQGDKWVMAIEKLLCNVLVRLDCFTDEDVVKVIHERPYNEWNKGAGLSIAAFRQTVEYNVTGKVGGYRYA